MIQAPQPRRFSGIARLYTEAGFTRIQMAHVCIIGVGGVGSWAGEALARSGIGRLTLIDLDHVTESNINRQLIALDSTLGKAKITVLAERIYDIHPDCHVDLIEDFITLDNINTLIPKQCDYVIDCIDHANTKAALIAHCRLQETAVITIGGTGGKLDPTQIRLMDLSRTEQDMLLSKTRKVLRQVYDFPRDLERTFNVLAVVSAEAPKHSASSQNNLSQSHLNCGGFGSATHCTASFAFVAVSKVLQQISDHKPANTLPLQ